MISVVQKEYDHYEVFYETNGVKLGEFYIEVDGYWVFAPELRGGYWDEHVMEAISHRLKVMNAPWHQQIMSMEEQHGNKE